MHRRGTQRRWKRGRKRNDRTLTAWAPLSPSCARAPWWELSSEGGPELESEPESELGERLKPQPALESEMESEPERASEREPELESGKALVSCGWCPRCCKESSYWKLGDVLDYPLPVVSQFPLTPSS